MRTDPEVTRSVRSWLEEGVDRVPDRVLDSVLEAVPCPILAVPRHLVDTRPGPLTGLVVDHDQPSTKPTV